MMFEGKGNFGSSHHGRNINSVPSHKPTMPKVKFTGTIPKGCKLKTETLAVEYANKIYRINIDFVYGSEKSLRKAIIKTSHEIKSFIINQRYTYREIDLDFHFIELGFEIVHLPPHPSETIL